MQTASRATSRRSPQKRRRYLRFIGLIVLLAILAAAATTGWMVYRLLGGIQDDDRGEAQAAGNDNSITFTGQERVSLVIMGHDVPELVNGERMPIRSDSLMIATLDPLTQEIDIVSIPRDLRVLVPGRSHHDKINAAYAYGGPEKTVETVEDLFGIQVQGYVDIGVEAFVEAVDLLGGVDVVVPYRMKYDDPLQDLHIDIQKGPQHLDGYQAMGFVRERYGDPRGDLGRIERQQQFLKAMAQKMFRVESLPRVPEFVNLATKYVRTNLTTQEMLALAYRIRRPDAELIRTVTLPTYDLWISDIAYQAADEQDIRSYADKYIRGIDRERFGQVTVDVLNGTDRSGWASDVAGTLKTLGYDVQSIANAPDKRETTLIRHQPHLETEARVLARHLHDNIGLDRIELAEIEVQEEESPEADATPASDLSIVLGGR